MIVLDAAAAVEWLLRTPRGERAVAEMRGQILHSVDIVDVEATNALRGLVRRGEVELARAAVAVGILPRLPIVRHASTALIARVWELRETHSADTAAYLALAEHLDAPLLTADARLARSHGHRATITSLA